MKNLLSILAVSTALTAAGSAQAALLEFDLSGLSPTFGLVAPTGGFVFDTDTQDFASIDFTTGLGAYGDGSGTFAVAGSFGPNQLYGFNNGSTEFVLDLLDFDGAMSGLLPGDTISTFGFGIEGEMSSPFVPSPGELYSGSVTITGVDAATTVIPLPAGLPLLALGLAGLGLLRRRNA